MLQYIKHNKIATHATCLTKFLRIQLSEKFETSFDNLNNLQMNTVPFTTPKITN